MTTRTRIFVMAIAIVTSMVATAPAYAQLNGENLLGDTGVKSGSQAAPGLYIGNLFYRYTTDTIRNANGQRIVLDPEQRGSQTINAAVPLVVYVSRARVFGANYGAMAVLPLANGSLEAPAFGLQEHASTGLSDAYIMPLQLGWHMSRADVTTGFAFFAPTGRYAVDASDNLGKGMWSYELSAGATAYVDEARTISVSTTAFWETHTKKQDTAGLVVGGVEIAGVKVGQLLTLEGGAAKSFLGGAAHIGAAYNAQWKVTRDELGFPDDLPFANGIPGRHRVFALGPDVTVPIAFGSRLVSLVNVRYLWEMGARTKTEGPSLLVTTTFPVPSITIPGR